MANYLTIKSRKLGRNFEFFMPSTSAPHKTAYIRLTDDRTPGTLGRQICYGGTFLGNTVAATEANFAKECRAWYRQHVALVSE